MRPDGDLYLWYTVGPVPQPLGVFDRPADMPQFNSVLLPDNSVSRILERGTQLLDSIAEVVPGQVWKWLQDPSPPPAP